jgi:hypothetical protein
MLVVAEEELEMDQVLAEDLVEAEQAKVQEVVWQVILEQMDAEAEEEQDLEAVVVAVLVDLVL